MLAVNRVSAVARATLVSGFFLPPAYLAANGGACDAHSPGCVRKLFQLI